METVVPGDNLRIKAGDIIPADALVLTPEPTASYVSAADAATPTPPCPCCGSRMRIIEVFERVRRRGTRRRRDGHGSGSTPHDRWRDVLLDDDLLWLVANRPRYCMAKRSARGRNHGPIGTRATLTGSEKP